VYNFLRRPWHYCMYESVIVVVSVIVIIAVLTMCCPELMIAFSPYPC
jgi:hypothetical protein